MSTPADPSGRSGAGDLPELDRPPAWCLPRDAPEPEAVGRAVVAGCLVVLALLAAGAFVGGVVLVIALLVSAVVAALTGLRLMPVHHRPLALGLGHAVVVAAVLVV